MIAAVVIAVGVMLVSAGPISDFVDRHPTVKMLALSLPAPDRRVLVAEGLDQHIPKGYIYFAMAFSVFVEMLNLRLRGRRRPVHLRESYTRQLRRAVYPKKGERSDGGDADPVPGVVGVALGVPDLSSRSGWSCAAESRARATSTRGARRELDLAAPEAPGPGVARAASSQRAQVRPPSPERSTRSTCRPPPAIAQPRR